MVKLCQEAISNGYSFEACQSRIEDILSANDMKASAKAHWHKAISVNKNGYNKSGTSAPAIKAMANDERETLKGKAIKLWKAPFSSALDLNLSQRDFDIMFCVLEALEGFEKIEFFEKAIAKEQAEIKQEKIQRAMALLKAEGILKDAEETSGMIDESKAF